MKNILSFAVLIAVIISGGYLLKNVSINTKGYSQSAAVGTALSSRTTSNTTTTTANTSPTVSNSTSAATTSSPGATTTTSNTSPTTNSTSTTKTINPTTSNTSTSNSTTTNNTATYGNTTSATGTTNTSIISTGQILPTPKEVFRVYVSPTAQGVRSENVKNLQNYLIANGYLSAGSNSGYYGSQTVAAVLALQQANNISSDGKTVGPKTLAIINGYAKSLVGTQSASQSAISLGNNLPPPCQNGVPSITVLSPNGGEVYSMDDSLPFYRTPITVKWASCGISPNNQPVQIDLVMPQYSFMAGSGFSNFYTLAQVPDNQGIVTVTIPLWYGFTYGNNFKISLSLPNFVGPNPPSDMSDNFFAVTSHVNLIKNPAFSDQTISPNVTHQKIGSYLLQNNSNEPISFNYTNSQGEYLQVDLLDSMTNTTIPINDFSNLEVDLNSVNIELTPPPVARNFIQVFPNNTPIIAPHQTATLDIYVDINTAATGTVQASIPSLAIVGVTTMQNYYVPSYVLGQTTTVGLYAQHGSSH